MGQYENVHKNTFQKKIKRHFQKFFIGNVTNGTFPNNHYTSWYPKKIEFKIQTHN